MINSDQPKQSNKPVSNDSVILNNGERINGANKIKSTYHDACALIVSAKCMCPCM